ALAGVGGVVAGVGGALAGAGLALLFPGAASPAAEPDRRVPFVEQAAAAGISPESWELDAVQTRLLALEGRLDVVRVLTIVRTRAAEARATADRAGAELASARNAAVASVATSGLDPRLVPLALAQQAHALAAWAKAAREEAMVRARLDETDRQVAAATDEISRWLREVGVADVASAEDSRVPLVEAVQRRVARLAEIDRALADLNRRAADLDATIATSASELDEIWIRAGVDPDDRAALIARLDQRRTWTQLRADRAGLQSRIEALSAEAEAAAPALGVADPVRLGVAEAEALVARLQEEAAALQSRASEVARIKADIGVAEGGTAWADARTKLAEAEGGLARERESRTEKLLARLVLEDARAAYRTQHASPVLSRAQGWFARFTHGGWRLDVDPAGQGELYAVDTRLDRRRALGELSDATRVQLLLAARLAAIEEQESGSGPIPLCLDEVLSTTDPGRFREVATSALELVRSGRQVLYFTADPAEADHWRAACAEAGADQPRVIDLGSPSGTGEAWGERHRVAPHPAEGVPEPLGDDADAYAQALGVPAPDGFRPLSAWHLVHVLYDDLPALRRCLQRRVDRVGPWREARRTPSAHLLDEPLAKRVDARVRLLGAVLDAWRVGRGRPVTAEDLGASVVSSTFRGRVQELVLSHGRDARAFARAVRDLPRFRSDAADRLEAHLEEQGILDPAEPLDADAIVRRAVAAVAVDVDQGVITAEEAVAFVDGVLGLVGEQ
ncbi:MAG: ATP-binding protein, partial [Myxococcota bacterium]